LETVLRLGGVDLSPLMEVFMVVYWGRLVVDPGGAAFFGLPGASGARRNRARGNHGADLRHVEPTQPAQADEREGAFGS